MKRPDYALIARKLYERACLKFDHLNIPFPAWQQLHIDAKLAWIHAALGEKK